MESHEKSSQSQWIAVSLCPENVVKSSETKPAVENTPVHTRPQTARKGTTGLNSSGPKKHFKERGATTSEKTIDLNLEDSQERPLKRKQTAGENKNDTKSAGLPKPKRSQKRTTYKGRNASNSPTSDLFSPLKAKIHQLCSRHYQNHAKKKEPKVKAVSTCKLPLRPTCSREESPRKRTTCEETIASNLSRPVLIRPLQGKPSTQQLCPHLHKRKEAKAKAVSTRKLILRPTCRLEKSPRKLTPRKGTSANLSDPRLLNPLKAKTSTHQLSSRTNQKWKEPIAKVVSLCPECLEMEKDLADIFIDNTVEMLHLHAFFNGMDSVRKDEDDELDAILENFV